MINKFLSASAIILIASCNMPEEKNSDLPMAEPAPAPAMHTKDCYVSINGTDTVMLKMTPDGDYVTGELGYNYTGKDKNDGTIKGQFYGDTLVADYTFNSEGMQSVRQVVFLKTGEGLVEGYGPVEEKNGRMIFTDVSKADFSQARPLKKADCE